jgi:hypothetical protein
MEMGSTGSLTVAPSGAPRISIYLMQGEILAAEAEDDGQQLVLRLVNSGRISGEVAQSLLDRLDHVTQVGDVLFGTVPDDLVMELYGYRFRQNLADFLLSDGSHEFVDKEDIHVENVQVGHDSYELLEQLYQDLARVRPLLPPDGPTAVVLGDEPPSDTQQVQLLEGLPADGSLDKLLATSPYEPIHTLLQVASLLDQGSLCVEGLDDPDDEDEDTAELPPLAEQPEDDASGVFDEPLVVDDEVIQPMVVDDLDMLDTEVVGTETMAMFADHDFVRGRGGEGIFTVDRELLDTVDLSGLELIGPGERDEELLLEMEDGDEVEAAGGAVSLRFGSPPLTSEEAITKIEVTNEVLRQLALALDDEHGSGSGQASVQLLVESAGTEYAPLFARVEAGRDGCLSTERVLANIGTRPEGERRRLLNRAMKDLVERGFTMAVERVSEARFETVLERIAGYQHRLGL